jgi:2-polyprenyl-3-methyl-5-hydroxy-6-metoxy-1,4-benzoquinol methylase
MRLSSLRLVVDVQRDITVIDEPSGSSQQQIAIIPLVSPGNGRLGIAVDLTWIRELHYHNYWDRALLEWRRKYAAAQQVETQGDVENLALWPMVDVAHPCEEVLGVAFTGSQQESQQYNQAQKVPFAALREGLRFEEGVETTIMRYPELVALIDGALFRFPEAYFIRDMAPMIQGSMAHRDPDWFRTFNGLPTRWRGRHCELCGSDNAVVRHIIGPSRIVRCKDCGLEYDNPQAIIATAALDKYASTIHDQRKSAKSMVRAEQSAEILIKGLEAIDSGLFKQPLLDIGCASGELLYALRERYDWPNDRLWGVDPSRMSFEIARTVYGLNAFNTELDGADFRDGTFGIITIFNTIEHLASPRAVLAHAHRLLAPGGCVLIGTVPNAGCLASALFPEGFIAKNFPDGQHHYHYTPDTLARLCTAEGFEVIRLDGETREPVLDKVKETAIWLAYSCGVPLRLCQDESQMLRELEDRLSRIQKAVVERQGSAYRFALQGHDFESAEALIAFWKREIWQSPYLSDEFDLWLRRRNTE